MPNFNTYNNNQDRPITNTYSSVSFANGTSKIMPTRFSINYFNKVMSISIALRNNDPSEQIPRFDNEHQITVYVSYLKAKILHDAIVDMLATKKNNVCIELKNGLLKVSNGIEYGSESPCFTITYADDKGKTNEVIYQTNTHYTAAYNYTGDSFSTMAFPNLEIDTFVMALEQYYLASSYAIAATVKESNAYNHKNIIDAIKGNTGSSRPNSYSNRTFLSGNGNNSGSDSSYSSEENHSYQGSMQGVPKEYEQSSFDDIAQNMLG